MSGFRCAHPPRLTGSAAAGLLACHDGGRVLLFGLDDLKEAGEVALAVDADADLGFVGNRLLVLSRAADGTTVHLIDPHQLRVVATAAIDAAARLLICVGTHAMVAAKSSLLILEADGDELSQQPVPLRGAPSSAGALPDGRVLVNVGGHVETWDLELRRPLHRIRADHQLAAQFLGGARDQIWMIPSARASHLEVLPLDGRGPWARPVDGPVLAAAGLVGTDALVLASAAGAPELVSLARRDGPITPLPQPPATALWLGDAEPAILVTAAQGAPLRSWVLSTSGGHHTATPRATSDTTTPDAAPDEAAASPVEPAPAAPVEPSSSATPVPVAVSVSDRLRAWRERLRPARASRPLANASRAELGAWRTALASWGRAQLERATAEPPPWDEQSSLARAAAHLDLPVGASRGLALLYAAHLLGGRVARADLAAAIADATSWDEALGHGTLRQRGVARWGRSAIWLVSEMTAALDELPPRHARMIAGPEGSLLALAGPCAVLAATDGELVAAAERAAVTLGTTIAILDEDRDALAAALLEARVRGAVPMLTAPALAGEAWLDELGTAVVAVPEPGLAALGIPLLFQS